MLSETGFSGFTSLIFEASGSVIKGSTGTFEEKQITKDLYHDIKRSIDKTYKATIKKETIGIKSKKVNLDKSFDTSSIMMLTPRKQTTTSLNFNSMASQKSFNLFKKTRIIPTSEFDSTYYSGENLPTIAEAKKEKIALQKPTISTMLIPPGISDGKTPQNRKRLSMISRTSYTSMKSQENIVLSVQGERAKLLLDNYILFEKARSRLKYLIFKSKNIEKEEIQDNLITAWESVVRSVKFLKSFKLKFSGKKIIGDIYLQVRNFQEAISQYTLVKYYAQKHLKYSYKLIIYPQIGYCYRLINEHKKALRYYKKQLQLAWDLGNRMSEVEAYDKIGLQYFYLNDQEKTQYYHQKAMEGRIISKDSRNRTLSKKSLVYKKKEFFEKASAKLGGTMNTDVDFLQELFEDEQRQKSKKQMKRIKRMREEKRRNKGLRIYIEEREDEHDLPSPRVMSRTQKKRTTNRGDSMGGSYDTREVATSRSRNAAQFTFPELLHMNRTPSYHYLKRPHNDHSIGDEQHALTMSIRKTRAYQHYAAKGQIRVNNLKKKMNLQQQLNTRLKRTIAENAQIKKFKNYKPVKCSIKSEAMPFISFPKFVHLSSLRNNINIVSFEEMNDKMTVLFENYRKMVVQKIYRILKKEKILESFIDIMETELSNADFW